MITFEENFMFIMTTREKYINPYTDFGFKKLFGTKANKELLIDFLNQLITEQGTITDLQFLSAEQMGRNIFERKAVFDIYCENEKGEKFIVEMQKAEQSYFKDRSVYYSTFPIQEQAMSGNWNFQLKAVYFVGVLDFVFDENRDDEEVFHHEVKLIDTKTSKVFYDKLTFIYLEMPKFNKTEDELSSRFDKWLYVLKSLPKFQQRPRILQEQIFKKLFSVAALAKLNPEEVRGYEDSLKVYRDNINVVDTAKAKGIKEGLKEGLKKGLEKGLKKGIKEGLKEGLKKGIEKGKAEGVKEGIEKGKAEGIKEGIEKGIEKGKAEGIKEGIEKGIEKGKAEGVKEIAKSLLNMNVPIDQIMKATGLSENEINEIIKN
jgi:predicted transposase/invertase (TIGR01784 family)